MLEVVGQERADGPFDDSLGEDGTPPGEGGGDVLGHFGIDGNGLELRVDASGEVAPDNGVLPLKLFQEEVAGSAEPSARVCSPRLARNCSWACPRPPGGGRRLSEPRASRTFPHSDRPPPSMRPRSLLLTPPIFRR
jgi:hypothetical protein